MLKIFTGDRVLLGEEAGYAGQCWERRVIRSTCFNIACILSLDSGKDCNLYCVGVTIAYLDIIAVGFVREMFVI